MSDFVTVDGAVGGSGTDPNDSNGPSARGPGRRAFVALLGVGIVIGAGAGYALRSRSHEAQQDGASPARETPSAGARTSLYFSSSSVYALRASNGTIRWARALNATGPVAVGGDSIYVADLFGYAYALNEDSGDIKWAHQVSTNTSGPYLSAADGRVYAMGGDGYIYALDATTGRELWNCQTGSLTAQPLAYRDLVYVGSPDAQIFALDAATGNVRWKIGHPNSEANAGSLAVTQDLLFASGDSKSYVIAPETGRVLDEFNSQVQSAANGMVYLTNQDASSLQALNLETKHLAWTQQPPDTQFGRVTVGNGLVYSGVVNNGYAGECCTRANDAGEDWIGRISAYTVTTGHNAWNYPAPEGNFSAPLLANGIVYIVGNFNVYALEATTGRALWVTPTTEQVIASNLEMSSVLYFGRSVVQHRSYRVGQRRGRASDERPEVPRCISELPVGDGGISIYEQIGHYARYSGSGQQLVVLSWRNGPVSDLMPGGLR
jgi:outer membrane protein assembly factor BamB